MKVLYRKVARDMIRAKAQYLSICVMVALGVAFLIGSYSVYENLSGSYALSYRKLEFEDFSIRFNSAPSYVVARLREIPGIEVVEGRLSEDTAIELDAKSGTKLAGRLISIPTHREPKVNRLKIVAGRNVRPDTPEVLLESAFAKHHELTPGDTLIAIRGSSRLTLTISGIVQSPEYLYVVRSKQDLIATPDSFGVMFLDEGILGALFQRSGTINEVHATVVDPTRAALVMRQAAAILAPFDPETPVPREDQPSYQMLQQDVQGFQSYAVLFPLLFLGAAAVAVYSMLTRVVHSQRPEIGLFRSLGLSRGEVARHYLIGTVAIGSIGSALGCLLGIVLGDTLSRFYMTNIEVPYEEVTPRIGVMATGVIVGLMVCGLAGFVPSLSASQIPPAEAMKPVTPTFGRSSIQLDRLLPRLSSLDRIPLRNVFRQPRRTISTLIGVVAGMCLMVTASGLLDSMSAAMDQLLGKSFGYDIRADFYEFQSKRVVQSARSWPGVVWAEGTLELPAEFRKGNLTYSALLNGVEQDSKLKVLNDSEGREVRVTDEGGIFGPTLRKRLDLKIGDRVEVTLDENLTKETSTTKVIFVAGFCEEAIGTQVYLPRSRIETLFRDELDLPGNAITGLLVQCDPARTESIRARLLDLPGAASALSTASMKKMVEDLMKNSETFIHIMELFGAALAMATIYNMITVNVMERQSEAATLRTLGIGRRALGRMIVLENLLVAGIGIAVGLPIAHQFVELFWQAAQTEQQQDLFAFEVMISTQTYVQTAVAIVGVALISLILPLRYLDRLDLSRAVKERST